MASSGYTTLQLYHSNVPSAVPVAANLIPGELSINTADGVLYYKDAAGNVASIRGSSGSNSGFSGYSGYSGVSGFSGYSGYSGRSGAPGGSSGYSGYSGYSSFSGYSGQSGQSGYSGNGVPAAGTAGNILVSNGSSFVSEPPATAGLAKLNTNNGGYINATSFGATGAGSVGDQKFTVTYTSYSGGLGAGALQLGHAGYGVTYTDSSFDGNPGLAMITDGGSGLYISNTTGASLAMYAQAYTCYKGGSSTSWVIYSDSRIKRNITPYEKGLAELNQIEIKNFEFNGLGNTQEGQKGLGVIADDVAKILPNSVKTIPTKLNPGDTERTDLKTFDNTELIYLLVKSVQELSAEIAILKATK